MRYEDIVKERAKPGTDYLLTRQGEWPSHLQPFHRSFLPPEAFSYRRYMERYNLTKADAKRVVQGMKQEVVFKNDQYQVNVQLPETSPDFFHLSIKLISREPVHDWRDLQAIKNMLVGPDHEGIELYPRDDRLVDTANQYHLWVLRRPGQIIPVGFQERLVIDAGTTHDDGSVQRPIPQPPEEKPMDNNIRPRTRADIHAIVCNVVLAIANIAPETAVPPTTALGRDRMRAPERKPAEGEFGLDAIDHVEILINVEDALGIQIPDADMGAIATVGDLIDYACRTCGVAEESPA